MIAALLTLAVAVWAGLVWSAQRKIMFPAPPLVPMDGPEAFGAESVWLDLGRRFGGGKVEMWLLPPREGGDSGRWMLFAHGNGELIDFWPAAVEPARRAGIGVALVEYPGYGRSSGRPSQASVEAAMVAAFDRLAGRDDVDPEKIIGYGRSLGGGAVCRLALQRPLAGLVLESTFTSVRPFARSMGVPGLLVRDPFDNASTVDAYPGPILILHGERDAIIPVEHGRRLHRLARESELVLLPCGHNDCPRSWPTILDWIERRLG